MPEMKQFWKKYLNFPKNNNKKQEGQDDPVLLT